MPVKSVIFNQSQLIFHYGIVVFRQLNKDKSQDASKNKPSFSDLGSLYVIYMIIIIKFHATEFPNMINLLRALRFTFEELIAFKGIFWHYQLLNSGFVNKQNKSPLVNLDQ